MEAGIEIELDGQYRELREAAGWLRRSRTAFEFAGPDAAELLQGQLTNDVEALEPGQGCYAALLDRKGHLQADMRVLRLGPDEFGVGTETGCADAVAAHFNLYRVGSDVEISRPDLAVVSVIGPGSRRAVGAPGLPSEHDHAEASIAGAPVRIVATDAGIDLVFGAERYDAITRELLAEGGVEVSEAAAEIVRVESGRPRFGAEMGAGIMPAEAGIVDRAVSFSKGCYIGQETVARLHYRGRPNRMLRGLRLSTAVGDGDVVRLGEREVGSIGTAVLSPALGPIALAILRREAEPGGTVAVGDGATSGEVVELPFVDNE